MAAGEETQTPAGRRGTAKPPVEEPDVAEVGGQVGKDEARIVEKLDGNPPCRDRKKGSDECGPSCKAV